jgi:L-gulono-1,4-lactone dehydrogenase
VSDRWHNWARNQRCAPALLARPRDESEVAELVAGSARRGQRVRAVGAGHSFTGLVSTAGSVLDLAALTGLHALDGATGHATFGAGTTLADASVELARHGRALENLGDIAVQTVAGAVGTGTHGTGIRFGNLSSTLVGGRLVTGDGSVVDLGADAEVRRAAQVHLGALGVLTEVTVRTVPAFTLEADERVEHVDDVLADLDDLVDGHDQGEFFWFPGSELALVKRNQRSDAAARPRGRVAAFVSDEVISNALYGAVVAAADHVPAAVGVVHAVLRRLPASRYAERSDRVFASPRRVRFVEMELAVARHAFLEAFTRLRAVLAEAGRAVPFPVECRFVAGDDADLSPAHGGDRAYLAVHLSPRSHDPMWFRAVADALDDLGARPHWGKLHPYTAADLAPRYPRWEAFQAVRRRFDPHGTFANDHLDRVLGPVTVPTVPA